MNAFKNVLIVILCLTTVGSSYYAWTLSQELSVYPQTPLLSTSAKKPSSSSSSRSAPIEVSSLDTTEHGAELEHEESGEPNSSRGAMASARREAIREVVESPEFQSLQSFVRKGTLDRRYAPLFKQLNLSPADLDTLKRLLVEKQNTQSDVIAAARNEGLDLRNNREELMKLMDLNRSDIDGTIKDKFGEQIYEAYQKYETTMPYRGVVDTLGKKLSYTPNPLTDAQENQMIDLIARTQPAISPNSSRSSRGLAAFRFGDFSSTTLTPETLNQARGILTPDQFTALSLLQQEQQANAKMSGMIRDRIKENNVDSR